VAAFQTDVELRRGFAVCFIPHETSGYLAIVSTTIVAETESRVGEVDNANPQYSANDRQRLAA
jgi:hypothetical protein